MATPIPIACEDVHEMSQDHCAVDVEERRDCPHEGNFGRHSEAFYEDEGWPCKWCGATA